MRLSDQRAFAGGAMTSRGMMDARDARPFRSTTAAIPFFPGAPR